MSEDSLLRLKLDPCVECELDRVTATIRSEFPDFKIVEKTDSTLMLLIGFLLYVLSFGKMDTFMDHYVTTIGTTVYVPANWGTRSLYARASILRHERVHMKQRKRLGWFLFVVGYLFFPLPMGLAWGRMRLEREAYEESMWAQAVYYGPEVLHAEQVRDSMIQNFTGAAYLWMWPFRSKVEHWYDGMVASIERELDANKAG